jgi:hypothetical protein
VLHYFSKTDDVVMSLFVDKELAAVCSAANHTLIACDVKRDGWPADAQPNLVLMKAPSVENSPSMDPQAHVALVSASLKQVHKNTGAAVRLALICDEWIHKDERVTVFNYRQLLENAGWTLTRCIPARRSEPPEKELQAAIERRELLNITRYFLIAEKADGQGENGSVESSEDEHAHSSDTDTQDDAVE